MRRWLVVAVGVVGLVLAGLIYLTSQTRTTVSAFERALREGVAPLQTGFSGAVRWASEAAAAVRSLPRLQEENRRLRQRVAALEAQLWAVESVRRENRWLRESLNLEQYLPAETVTARVIARPAEQWFSTVTLSRGARDGLAPGMPVVAAQGIVGHIESVTPNTARVILITDPRSAVGGVVLDRDDPVLVEGSGNPAREWALVRPLVHGAQLEVGDEVVTSGLSQLFPAGIPIGRIERVEEDETGLQRLGVLRPYVDLARITWVTVIVSAGENVWWPPEPPAASEALEERTQ